MNDPKEALVFYMIIIVLMLLMVYFVIQGLATLLAS
jgi:hypothetical protein